MWSLMHPELLHLAETLHPDSEVRTDAGLYQHAELPRAAPLLQARSVTHLKTAALAALCLMVVVTVLTLIWSSVAGHHYNALLEVDGKQMGRYKVLGLQCGGL